MAPRLIHTIRKDIIIGGGVNRLDGFVEEGIEGAVDELRFSNILLTPENIALTYRMGKEVDFFTFTVMETLP